MTCAPRIVASLCLCFLMFACSPSDPANNDHDGGTGNDQASICQEGSCPQGQYCDPQGVCRIRCSGDKDCAAVQQVCQVSSGRCVDCLTHKDCPANHTCRLKRCLLETPCESSKTCPANQLCDKATKRCVECEALADCQKGFVCREGVCIPTPKACDSTKDCKSLGQVCDTSQKICVECVGNADCDKGTFCKNNICISGICTPGEKRCMQGKETVEICADDSSAWNTQSCQSNEFCDNGTCKKQVCKPKEKSCDNGKVVACDDRGTAFRSPTPCPDGQYCKEGACHQQVCKPGSNRCKDNSVETCDAQGAEYSSAKACEAKQFCEAGACKDWTCTPGEASCDGDTPTKCKANGSGFDKLTPCTSEQFCDKGTCIPKTCKPGDVICAGNTTKNCQADGKSWVDKACGNQEYCENGSCKPQQCTPNTKECRDNSTARACASNGSAWTETPCQTNESCDKGQCVAQICKPNEQTCLDLKTVESCDANGLAKTKKSCASGEYCDKGSCLKQSCKPGERKCSGNELQACRADGSGYDKLLTCPTNQICKVDKCINKSSCLPAQFLFQIPFTGGIAGQSLAFSPDSKMIAAADEKGPIKLIDIGTGKVTKTISTTKSVGPIVFSPDGKYLIYGNSVGTVYQIELSTSKVLQQAQMFTDWIFDVKFDATGALLAGVARNGELKVWEFSNWQQFKLNYRHVSTATLAGWTVRFSPNGQYFASGTHRNLEIWETSTWTKHRTILAHTDRVTGTIFSSDSKWITTSSRDKVVKLWEVSTGKLVRSFQNLADGQGGVAISRDDKYLFTHGVRGSILIWDIASGKIIHRLSPVHKDIANPFVLSPDGKFFASGGWVEDKTLRVWQCGACTPRTQTCVGGETQICKPDGSGFEKLLDCQGDKVSTFAGTGTAGYQDGQASSAQFNRPAYLAFDQQGNLYVAGYLGHRVRKITPSGVVSTVAGTGVAGDKDGSGVSAQLNRPQGLAFDEQGMLFVSDIQGHKIRKITPSGVVSTVAGTGVAGHKDGPSLSAQFKNPNGLAFDLQGNLFIADPENHQIRMIDLSGNVSTVAGTGVAGYKDGPSSSAQFNLPRALVFDEQGNLFVSDWGGHRIRKIDLSGMVSTVAGTGVSGHKDGPSSSAQFKNPHALTIDSQGNLFVADAVNHRVRKITPSGVVSTVAGAGSEGFRDGPASTALFAFPIGVTIDLNRTLFVSDWTNRIRKVTQTCKPVACTP